MSVKMTVTEHLSAPAHVRYALLASLLCLRFIWEVNKRKLITARYSAAEKIPLLQLAFGGVITDRNKQQQTSTNAKYDLDPLRRPPALVAT